MCPRSVISLVTQGRVVGHECLHTTGGGGGGGGGGGLMYRNLFVVISVF